MLMPASGVAHVESSFASQIFGTIMGGDAVVERVRTAESDGRQDTTAQAPAIAVNRVAVLVMIISGCFTALTLAQLNKRHSPVSQF